MKFEKAILFLAMVLALASLAAAVYFHSTNVRYGFVNTEKILESFGESQKVSGEIRAEEERWLTEARIIEDSLAAFEARIQKDYGKLSVKEKLERYKAEHAAGQKKEAERYQPKHIQEKNKTPSKTRQTKHKQPKKKQKAKHNKSKER